VSNIQLVNVSQSFDSQTVLDGIDLTVESGQYVVLLGISGSGKTTCLRVIAGLQQPDAGDVQIDGQSVLKRPPRMRDVALVDQHDGLYPHLSVAASLRLGLSRQVSRSAIEQRVAEVAALTGIERLLERYPQNLSGGERRRAAVAKALARRNAVRLLDEPLSALDAAERGRLQDDLLRWHQAVPGTTVHVTHDGYEAMRMADKIAVLENGRIIQYASPANVYDRPASVTVARSTGLPPINLLPATFRGGKVVADDPAVCLHRSLNGATEGQRLMVGVRPESLHSDSGDNSFVGRVGRVTRIDNRFERTVSSAHTTLRYVSAKRTPQIGDEISLFFSNDAVHEFDAYTEKRF